MTARRAVVTGADGFIGAALCARLHARGWAVTALTRAGAAPALERRALQGHGLGDLAALPVARLHPRLAGADVVYHLAGRAHRPREPGPEQREALYLRDNLLATRRIAQAAIAAGVPRLVYLSSIKALADVSEEAIGPDREPAPVDAYGRSKLAAERCLRGLAASSPLGVSVLRPPLVYGPGVKGNLARLLAALARGVPLPLGRARQPRSMIALENLCDLLIRLAVDEGEFEQYHLRDDEDLEVAELIERCARLLGRRARLVSLPPAWLRSFDRLAGTQWHARLFAPLRVDDSRTRQRLAWRPPCSVDEGLARMVAGWREGP